MLLFWSRLRAGAGEIRQFVSKSATNWRPLPEAVMEALEAVAALRVIPEILQAEAFRFDTSVFAQRMSEFVSQTLGKHRCLYQRYSKPHFDG